MADAIYPKFKEALLKADVDLDTANLRIALVSSAYTYNAAHDFHDDLTGILATSDSFTASSLTNGTLDFADITITGLDTGETATAYVLYVWTGTSATSHLIAYKDSAELLPLAGSTGVDVIVRVNAAGYFTL
jgi:hypothetical protein